ncbi:MAG: ABC transporter ATP-binding protein [Bacteriovoracaceae bacterium]|nr:ABC transporter ATP-binding protein [Bacteriovoracaceae bacterium]
MFKSYVLKFRAFRKLIGRDSFLYLVTSIVLSFIVFLTESSFAFILQGFLGALNIINSAELLPKWYPKGMVENSLILIAIGFFRSFFLASCSYFQSVAGNAFQRDQRNKIARFSLDFVNDRSSSQVISDFTDTIGRACSGIIALAGIIVNIALTVLFFILGLRIAPLEMLFSTFLLFVLVVPFKILDSRVTLSSNGLAGEWQNITGFLVKGMKFNFYLKIYGLIDDSVLRIKKSINSYFKHSCNYLFISAIRASVPNFLGILIIAILALVSIKYGNAKGGIVLSFFYIFIRFSQSASALFGSMTGFAINKKTFEDLYDINNVIDEKYREIQTLPQAPLSKAEQDLFQESIKTQGVSVHISHLYFKYPKPNQWSIHDFSLSLTKGDCLIVTGESGSGKSTLLSLLLGVNLAQKGEILINQKPLGQIKELLYEHLTYIGPDPYLIDGTIRDNLKFGHTKPESITDDEISNALEIACVKSLVESLPEELNFVFSENAQISTGQKQRIAIARGLLRRPKLLIMDECTSNLDHETECLFAENIKSLFPEMTVIIVTHRPIFAKLGNKFLQLTSHLNHHAQKVQE